MISVVKLKNGEVILGEVIDEGGSFIYVIEPLLITQEPMILDSGAVSNITVPRLYCQFIDSQVVDIPKKEILFRDLASDYYNVYHTEAYGNLYETELERQEKMLRMFQAVNSGEHIDLEDMDLFENDQETPPTYH